MILQLAFLSVIAMGAWFIMCLFVFKLFGATKDSKLRTIFFFFIVSGPIGWAILLIIVVYDMVDKISQKK